jgi:hypothetical protein
MKNSSHIISSGIDKNEKSSKKVAKFSSRWSQAHYIPNQSYQLPLLLSNKLKLDFGLIENNIVFEKLLTTIITGFDLFNFQIKLPNQLYSIEHNQQIK